MAIAVTTSHVSPSHFQLPGNLVAVTAQVTLDGSYSAGGYALAASSIAGSGNFPALSRILAVIPLGLAVSADGLTACAVSYNPTTGKLAAFTAAGDGDPFDESGAADCTGLTVNLLVLGSV